MEFICQKSPNSNNSISNVNKIADSEITFNISMSSCATVILPAMNLFCFGCQPNANDNFAKDSKLVEFIVCKPVKSIYSYYFKSTFLFIYVLNEFVQHCF